MPKKLSVQRIIEEIYKEYPVPSATTLWYSENKEALDAFANIAYQQGRLDAAEEIQEILQNKLNENFIRLIS